MSVSWSIVTIPTAGSELPTTASPPRPGAARRRVAAPAPHAGPGSAARRLALVSIGVYLALTAAAAIRALSLDDGHLVYTLDDPYIHLAMARTWLASHTMGIWPGDFAPASSSPVWTTLLTILAAIVGVQPWLPLALDTVSCLLLLPLFWWGSVAVGPGPQPAAGRPVAWWRFGAAALLPLVGHLPGLTLSGLEHPLHATVTVAYTVALFRVAQRGASPWRSGLYVLALLLPLVRLEGAFAVGVGAIVLLARRKPGVALPMLATGALPSAVLGLYSVRNGAFFLSNSIVVKAVPALSGRAWLSHLLTKARYDFTIDPTLCAVIVVALVWLLFGGRAHGRAAVEEALYFLGLVTLHVMFADIGWFDRYQAYLIILGLFFFVRHTWPRSVANPIRLLRQERVLQLGLIIFVLLDFGRNKLVDYLATPLATNNIYEQQYQMARFIAEYYPHGAVVANDIGLISLRAGGPITDLTGLGTTEIARLVRRPGGQRSLRPADIEPILRQNGADVIVIYPGWYNPALYAAWYPVASWALGKPRVTPAFSAVTWYAHTAAQFPALSARLHAYQPQLPADVQVRYYPAPAP